GPPEPTPASAWRSGEASAAIADLHQPWPHCLGGSIDGHGPRVVAHASWGDRDGEANGLLSVPSGTRPAGPSALGSERRHAGRRASIRPWLCATNDRAGTPELAAGYRFQ